MKKIIFVFLIMLLTPLITNYFEKGDLMANQNSQELKTFTPEIMLSLRRISEVKLSPDNKWIAYVLGVPNIPDNKIYKDIYIVSLDGKETIRLTNDNFGESNISWMPDSKSILYISSKEEGSQIWSVNVATKEQKKLTNIEGGINGFVLSPDGKKIAYWKDVKVGQSLAEKHKDLPKAKARLYEKLPVREWDEWVDEYYSHIFISDLDGGNSVDIMQGEAYDSPLKPFGGAEQIAWSPDGKELAYTCKKVWAQALSTNSDIYIYNLETKNTINITKENEGYDRDPLYSPDGKWIAYHSQKRAGFESDRVRLMLYERKTGKITELSKEVDQWVGETIWAPDSKSLYFSAEMRGTVQIYKIDLPDGKWKIITEGWYNFDMGLNITKDGKTIITCRRDMQKPYDIFKLDLTKNELKQLTDVNKDYYETLKPVRIEDRVFHSTDGKEIQTWVIFPPDFEPTKQYPMIVYCQGGPQSTVSQYFSFRWNFYLMASMGYVVVAPNRRGVPGFGQEWVDAISGDWGGKPMEDIISVTDAMAGEPYIKKNATAAVGASAGGYATFWLAGHNENKRYACLVAHSGVFNLESKYGATDELFFPNWEFGGPYWEDENYDTYEEQSPHKYAKYWNTPIFISTGERDFRVPYTQSLEAFTVAQVKGIPSRLLIFPEENHWVLKPQEAILWLREMFQFIDKHCKY